MKSYKNCPIVSLGYSDIATLIVVGCGAWNKEKSSCLKLDEIHYGGDDFYEAYLVTEADAEIGSHYQKVFECNSRLKIYDDDTCVFKSDFQYNRFEIYRAGNFGTIIRCLKTRKD